MLTELFQHLDEDEPGSVPYTRQLWRRDRDEGILRSSRVQGQQARECTGGYGRLVLIGRQQNFLGETPYPHGRFRFHRHG